MVKIIVCEIERRVRESDRCFLVMIYVTIYVWEFFLYESMYYLVF